MKNQVEVNGQLDIYQVIEQLSKDLYIRALKKLPEDVKVALSKAYSDESSPTGKRVLSTILENVDVAEREDNIVCQDTGLPVYFIEIGSRVHVDVSKLQNSITEGCRRATLEYPLRSNTLNTITRSRTGTNTGKRIPIIHINFVPDSASIRVTMLPKGSGSENISFLKMFTPADGINAVKKFIIDSVIEAGANPCPPTVIGVGLGGTSDLCMMLAKKAIARPIGVFNRDPLIAQLERDLLEAVNSLGIGPMGLGGKITSMALHIEEADTHITLNPVAINFQCWPARRATAEIYEDGSFKFLT